MIGEVIIFISDLFPLKMYPFLLNIQLYNCLAYNKQRTC